MTWRKQHLPGLTATSVMSWRPSGATMMRNICGATSLMTAVVNAAAAAEDAAPPSPAPS